MLSPPLIGVRKRIIKVLSLKLPITVLFKEGLFMIWSFPHFLFFDPYMKIPGLTSKNTDNSERVWRPITLGWPLIWPLITTTKDLTSWIKHLLFPRWFWLLIYYISLSVAHWRFKLSLPIILTHTLVSVKETRFS